MASSASRKPDTECAGMKRKRSEEVSQVGSTVGQDYEDIKTDSCFRPYDLTDAQKSGCTFRVLVLHGRVYDEGLYGPPYPRIDLMRVSLDPAIIVNPLIDFAPNVPDFEAISYAWEGIGHTPTVYFTDRTPLDYDPNTPYAQSSGGTDETHRFAVSLTVLKTLESMQPRTGYRLLWIDALCVSQADRSGRTRQVQMMCAIY
jgi:hypothetical protein